MGVPAKVRQNRPTLLVDSYYRPLHGFPRDWMLNTGPVDRLLNMDLLCLSKRLKRLGSRLWCLTVSLSLSHWYPGSDVVLDCIDS